MKDSSSGTARSAGIVMLATLISRIFGYLRDMIVARAFGATSSADAFYVAFRIPNFLRNLLAEGALSATFIPTFTEYLTLYGKSEAFKLANKILTLLILLLSLLTILGIIFAPFMVMIVAPGFSKAKMSLTAEMTRIMFPFLAFVSLSALVMGILNSYRSFFIPAVAPTMLSLAEIGAVFLICPLFLKEPVVGLAIGVLLGGAFQWAVQLPSLFKKGFFFKPTWAPKDEGVKRISLLLLPAVIGLSVNQINLLVDTIMASFLGEGSVSALYYANRLYQLPLALFGISLATVALPTLSASAAKKNFTKLKQTLSQSLQLIVLAMIPSSMILIFLGKPLVRLLFERGRFDTIATDLTFWVLFFYSFGLFFYAGVKVVAATFYSLKDTKTPVKTASFAMLINIFLNWFFAWPLGLRVGGLALATATSSLLNFSILLFILRKKIGQLGLSQLFDSAWKAFLSSVLMSLFAVGLYNYSLKICLPLYGFYRELFSLSVALLGGIVIFIVTTLILKIEAMSKIWQTLLKKFTR
ncbi:MAG: murein biosynthesis integral membrane protein MurJ [Candidatus Edwardsbacteria bacterium]